MDTPTTIPRKRIGLLSQLDDDLAFCTPGFNISHSLFGRFEWKDPVNNRSYDPGIDERTDPS